MMKRYLFFVLLFFFGIARGQEFISLWPKGKKPNFNGVKITDSINNERAWRVTDPGIYVFRASKDENNGSSVLICPGGGYERVSYVYNGFNLAKWFNTIGVNAFVLVYRLPHQKDLQQPQLAPLQDAQRAMKIIRSNAVTWNLKPGKVGVMGVSAGGHVATMLGTNLRELAAINDPLDSISSRPDFMVLLSPVVTMGVYAHPGSKKNFLGTDSSTAMIRAYSNELQVTAATAPSFIVHAVNDKTVSVQNSLLFYQALIDKQVNASLHTFPQGGHGIRMDNNPGSADLWLDLLERWLKEMNMVIALPFK